MATVDVDGAGPYHETLGSGPPLLLVQGGAGDAGSSAQSAADLATTHRVITYDRRGLARSGAGPGRDPNASATAPRVLLGHGRG